MPAMNHNRPSVPVEASAAVAAALNRFGASLVAAYLHGSAVAGGLRPDSDVDVMLVVDRPMDDRTRRLFLADLLRISGRPNPADAKRPLELVVFSTADLAAMPYPPRSEFVYGEWLRAGFEAGAVPQPHANPDFVVVIAQTRQAALILLGPQPRDLLPEIPDRDLRRAIGDARQDLMANLHGDERNVLLTLARMWCTLQTGMIVSKDVAAEWAAARLSGQSATLLHRAGLAYLGLEEDVWQSLGSQVEAVAGDLSERVAALA